MNNVSERSSHSTTPREYRDHCLAIRGIHIYLKGSILSEERTPSSNVQARESPSKSSDGRLSAPCPLTPTDAHLFLFKCR